MGGRLVADFLLALFPAFILGGVGCLRRLLACCCALISMLQFLTIRKRCSFGGPYLGGTARRHPGGRANQLNLLDSHTGILWD